MEFKDLVMQRYATKKFDGRKIDPARVDQLLEMIRFAPSALNIQPWKIKIVTDQKIKEQLKPASWDQEQITTCSHLLVFCANSDIAGLINKLEMEMKKAAIPPEGIQMIMQLARGLLDTMDPGQQLVWAQHHVFLALGNALNGAKSLGFDSCPMGGFDRAEYARILALPPTLVPTMLCPIGFAADKPMPKMRFKKEDIFF
ncbi:MAG: NAD(P)H-dependent oxidoreductase [Methanoregulaceae archaeon]|nr:NAD(P)H-dependent oxidoreductase [Methanoregulaceae archaeon]